MATSVATMTLEADHAILRLRDEQTGQFVIRSYCGSAAGRFQKQLFRLDKNVCVGAITSRAPRWLARLEDDPTLQKVRGEFRSVIAAPLMDEGRVIGTLALYDRIVPDCLRLGAFAQSDFELFTKFTAYVEHAISNAKFHALAREHQDFEAETGLPNSRHINKRIHEEITRTGGRDHSLALAVCMLENLDEIERTSGHARSCHVVERTVEALRSHLREFDVLGRTGNAEFTILLPDPGPAANERVYALARAVADHVSKDDALNDPTRIALSFGYAIYPSEGSSRDSLLAHARIPRIQVV
jgi:diguanylate cyclase (GGDEF)-like protein